MRHESIWGEEGRTGDRKDVLIWLSCSCGWNAKDIAKNGEQEKTAQLALGQHFRRALRGEQPIDTGEEPNAPGD